MKKLATFALLLLAACGGPPFRAHEKDADREATADTTTLVVMDDEVKWALELIDHREQLLPDGRLRTQLRFVNKTPKDLHVQMAWTFKDDADFSVEPTSPFEHVLVAAGQTKDVVRESMARGATRFHVEVKTAKSAEE